MRRIDLLLEGRRKRTDGIPVQSEKEEDTTTVNIVRNRHQKTRMPRGDTAKKDNFIRVGRGNNPTLMQFLLREARGLLRRSTAHQLPSGRRGEERGSSKMEDPLGKPYRKTEEGTKRLFDLKTVAPVDMRKTEGGPKSLQKKN